MYAQPDYPAALASLQSMDSEQLKEILNNDVKFDDFMKELPQVKSLNNEKVIRTLNDVETGGVLSAMLQNMLLASNKSLAEYNLSQEPVLREGKARLAEKHRTATSLSAGLKELQTELETKSGQVRDHYGGRSWPEGLYFLSEGWPGHLAGPPPGRHPGGGGGEREHDGVFPPERRQERRAVHGGVSGQEEVGSPEENQSRQDEGVATERRPHLHQLHHPLQTGPPTSPPLPWLQPAQHKLALSQP